MDDQLNTDKLKALVKDILLMNPKSSGILESAKDALKTVTGTQEPERERGGGDAQGVIRSLIERIEKDGPGSVFAGTMWNDEQRKRISTALKKTQEFYAGDPGIIVAWYVPEDAVYPAANGSQLLHELDRVAAGRGHVCPGGRTSRMARRPNHRTHGQLVSPPVYTDLVLC